MAWVENLNQQEVSTEIVWDPQQYTFPETEDALNQWDDDPRKQYQNKEWTTITTTTEKQKWQPRKEEYEYERKWEFTQNKFAIRNLDSNESWIPDSEKGKIMTLSQI